MNILYLATGVFDKGGISRYSRYQIEALRNSDRVKQVFVMSLHPPKGDVFEEDISVEKTYNGVSPLSKLQFISGALRVARRLEADVIWSNHVNLSPISVLAAVLTKGRSIVNIYGREVWSRLGGLRLWALRRCDHIVSDCHFTANWVQQNLKLNSKKMDVIWDCVDTRKFTPGLVDPEIALKYNVPFVKGRLRLMSLGRLESSQMHKGYHRIIETMLEIRDNLPVDYIIGGSGPALSELKNLVCRYGLEGRVFFTGSIKESDLSAVYRLSDIFVLISDRGPGRGEGIPLTPLEAAACGKPILVGNEDGSQEAVEDGVNGFILSPHDRQTLINRIHCLAKDAEMRNRMGKAARLRIERLHSLEEFARAIDRVLINNQDLHNE